MKKRHGEEQIIYALKRLETGSKGLEVCREMGISEQTLYNWKRELVEQIMRWFEIGSRRACGLVLMNRATFFYRSHAKDRRALKMRLRDLAMSRVRFGYLRLTVMLKREGWEVGKKLVYRLY